MVLFSEDHIQETRRRGRIEVICGSMFSGKTEELIRRMKRAKFARQRVEIFKPAIDTRYSEGDVVSHDSNTISSTPIDSSASILLFTSEIDVVGIDEAQFFDSGLIDVCNQLANNGVRVIIAGLDMDFKGIPFGPMPALCAIADEVSKVHAICVKCGQLASFSHRTVKNDKQVLLGETAEYEPLCRECLTIIGTAHVSANSVEEVKNTIYEQHPEIVAIELDRGRYTRLKNEMMGIEEDDTISVSKIIKEEKVGLFLATTILSYFQSKIGEDVDVKPGSEMIGAIEAAEDLEIPIALIDREINTTLQRALNKMGFVEKLKFAFSLLTSIFSSDEEDEIDIEELKNPDNLDELMEFFKDESPKVYEVLVQERDAYLAGNLLRIPQDHVIAVVGAGHKPGINRYLDNPETIPPLSQLEITKEKKGIPWFKVILALIPILFVVIFFLAYISGINITWNLYDFIIISMIMGFIGSILSGSKIQSAVVGGLVAPLTIIHPLLAAGWFSGLVEAKYRKVRKRDMANLTKIESLKDLWHNNIVRILLVVVGTNLGVSLATLVILPSQVFIPLFMKIFGG